MAKSLGATEMPPFLTNQVKDKFEKCFFLSTPAREMHCKQNAKFYCWHLHSCSCK